MKKTRSITRFLQIHPEICNIDQHLHMTLRLHTATHETVTHKGLISLHQKRGNDGVKRSLTRGVDIWVALFE